jgi:Fibronectin type III domain
MTTKTKLTIIKPVLGVTNLSDADYVSRVNAVYDGMNGNAAYPSPPVDMPGFKAAIDAYTAAVAAALGGGTAAITARNKRRADVTIMFRLLGHYVESACKNDRPTFVSSGFVASSSGQKTPPQPVAVPVIGSVDQGNTGQLLVTIKPVAKARSYDIRFGSVPAAGAVGGTNISWTTISVASTKPATPINNLMPGTTYTFQVRAFGKLGFSDWSDSVNRMVI